MARKDPYENLYPEQIDALQKYTTDTRMVYADVFRLRNKVALEDRPENQDLITPMEIQILRMVEMGSQKNDELKAVLKSIDAKLEASKGKGRKWWNLFWRAAGTVKKEGENLLD